MYKQKSFLALIPARGGSKGLPGKNIYPFAGKPLIAWTIQNALKSNFLDEVIVSTDSKEIASVAMKYGACVPFLRPASLSGDRSPVVETILDALDKLEKMGRTYDCVALLEPTHPLRKVDDIDNAIVKLIDSKKKADCIVSLGSIALEHPLYAKRIDKNGYVELYFKNKLALHQRQDLDRAYFPYGVIYLSYISAIRKLRAAYGGKIIPYFIERWQNYEINDIYDLKCAEAVFLHRKKTGK